MFNCFETENTFLPYFASGALDKCCYLWDTKLQLLFLMFIFQTCQKELVQIGIMSTGQYMYILRIFIVYITSCNTFIVK